MKTIYEQINFEAFDYKINIETENLEIKSFKGEIYFKQNSEHVGKFFSINNILTIILNENLKTWDGDTLKSFSRSSDLDPSPNAIDEIYETIDNEIFKLTQFLDLVIPGENRGIRLLSHFESKLFNDTNKYITKIIKRDKSLSEKEYIDKAHQFAEDLIFELSQTEYENVTQAEIMNIYSEEWRNSIDTSVKLKLGYTLNDILREIRNKKR